jgi:pimeloyl-ACP methyl ester carboxylesterase
LTLPLEKALTRLEPFFCEAGTGPAVVCIHSNASNSSQWRGLMDLLAPRHRVLAFDSYGSGKSPDWPSPETITLGDEVTLMEPVLGKVEAPFTLVGHSYGGAVALIAAMANPGRVRALALYEPTLFSLLLAESPPTNDAEGILNAVSAAAAALDTGNQDAAAQHFIDYWMGTGSWAQTPEARKPAIAAAVRHVRRWAHALTTEPTRLEAFRSLNIPVLYMMGRCSTASAKGVGRLLTKVLPQVEVVTFEELGHMGPLTHADTVNETVARFLQKF